MKFKIYYENEEESMGGWEFVGFFKLMFWLWLGRISPNETSDIYFIRRIENKTGDRI